MLGCQGKFEKFIEMNLSEVSLVNGATFDQRIENYLLTDMPPTHNETINQLGRPLEVNSFCAQVVKC